MGLFEKLDSYAASGAAPMHMPGHKRNTAAFPWLSGLAERDITEIEGFDNLNDPEGLFLDLKKRMAALWGARQAIPLVNGSTVGILAGIMSVLSGGGELLACRDSHRSVYHAAELAGAEMRYLTPAREPVLGVPLPVTPEEVSAALEAHPNIGLVCVTSPTYEGAISDIATIAAICHYSGVPLLVDCAHGAHLGLPGFPESCARYADMTVMSLHKTLPSLTQTAVMLLNPGIIDMDKVLRYVGMLQTSSPSYLLSGSIDGCVGYIEREGEEAAGRWLLALRNFRDRADKLKNIRLWEGAGHSLDPSKLLLHSDGERLARALREKYGIEPEYAAKNRVLCMTGMGDTEGSLSRLAGALEELDSALPPPPPTPSPAPLPERQLSIPEAVALNGALVPAERAENLVCGEYIWSYPPGVPLIVPGEVVDKAVLRALEGADNLHSTYKAAPKSIFCVDLTRNI